MPDASKVLPSDAQVSALARSILGRARYRNFRVESYDFLRIVGDRWRALMAWLSTLQQTDPTLYVALLVGLSLLCTLMLLQVVWTLRAALRVRPAAAADEAAVVELDFVREGRELARRGEHLEAAHRLLLAALHMLAEGRHIPLHPEDGNRAVCRKLTASKLPPVLRTQLVTLIVQTEQAWFGESHGESQVGPRLYSKWDAALAQLSRVARS